MEAKKKATTYRLERTLTDCKVYYFLVDADNKIVAKSGYTGYGTHSACFGNLFRQVPKDAVAAYVYHPADKMGYDDEAINRWVTDISEMGFRCEYLGVWGKNSYFQIKLEDMETKNQFCSTLTLIRCLYELSSARVPQNYFQLMDAKPENDKFLALQKAHKIGGYLGLGHNITSKDNGSDVPTLEVLFKRFEDAKLTPFSSGNPNLNICWARTDEEYNKAKEEHMRWYGD